MAGKDTFDAYQLPKLQNLESPDRFDELDVILDKAHVTGALSLLPKKEEDVRLKDMHESRIRTLRTRLYLLQYLPRDNRSPEIDEKLKNAIFQFQGEANLKQDKWVGPKTWTALQELISFEHPSNLSRWYEDDNIPAALKRAIKLRLFVFGFLPSKQAKDEKKLHKAIQSYAQVARILRLKDNPISPDLGYETVNLLFDQDHIASQLSKAGETFMMHRPPDVSDKKARQMVRKFIICFAKVELWLLGYDVSLDGTATFDAPSKSTRHKYNPDNYPVFHSLNTFWEEHGKTKKIARQFADRITGYFFNVLLQIQEEGERIQMPNQSDHVYEMLAKEKEDVLDKIWNNIKAIGSRIWDGIKRVWRWFKSLIKKVVKKISTWVRNIARLAYRYALNAFPVVKHIVKVTKETVSFLTHKTLKDSDVNHIVINRDNDFDYRIYVNPTRDSQTVQDILTKFKGQARIFRVGMSVLGLLVGTLVTVITSVAKAAGWFGLILALLKIYSKLKEIGAILEEKKALLAIV